jgi:NAD(P)-dependent dehydrogenase (short-subunit alcohol dehydrogenase family)
MAERQSLKGRVAVITGGSRGIGLAIAKAFAQQGCHIVITGRNEGSLQAAVSQIKNTDAEVTALTCDVSIAVDVQNAFASIQKHFHNIDVLVNNAGISHALAPVEKLSLEDWKQVIDTNLTGTFLCTRAALPMMRSGGTIVNNLSVAATRPFPGMAAYNASKFGALGFTKALREELRKSGIRVLALLPGATDTDIWTQFWPDAPREKMISPETVAEAVLHVVTLPEKASIEEIRLGPASGTL